MVRGLLFMSLLLVSVASSYTSSVPSTPCRSDDSKCSSNLGNDCWVSDDVMSWSTQFHPPGSSYPKTNINLLNETATCRDGYLPRLSAARCRYIEHQHPSCKYSCYPPSCADITYPFQSNAVVTNKDIQHQTKCETGTPIMREADCWSAANAVSKYFHGEVSCNACPLGCYAYTGSVQADHGMYWNVHAHGGRSENRYKVCQLSPTASATSITLIVVIICSGLVGFLTIVLGISVILCRKPASDVPQPIGLHCDPDKCNVYCWLSFCVRCCCSSRGGCGGGGE